MAEEDTVFICYASEDKDAAIRLSNDLRTAGANVWLDRESIALGQTWMEVIDSAIRNSRYFLFIISSNSEMKDGYNQHELGIALNRFNDMPNDRQPYLIPVRLDNSRPLHNALISRQWVDMFPDWDQGLKKIINALGLDKSNNSSLHKKTFLQRSNNLRARRVGGIIGAGNDKVPQEDQLGFKEYVAAFADLIESRYTKPPLVIGIYGTWGTGKSFLMEHIDKELTRRREMLLLRFNECDLVHPETFLMKLKSPSDPLSKYIRNNFSLQTSKLLDNWDSHTVSDDILENVIKDLNKLLEGDSIFDEHIFPRARLKERTKKLIESCSNNTECYLLNRLLIEDSYSYEISNRSRVDREERKKKLGKELGNVYVVKLNAWEYSSSRIIWPGLVRKIMDQMENEMPGNFINKLNINFLKIKYKRNTKNLFQVMLAQLPWLIILSLGSMIIINEYGSFTEIVTAFLGLSIASLLSISKGLFDIFSNPLGNWINAIPQNYGYGKQIDYMEKIHEDLKLLQKRLYDKNRILIIIDDLDRCEPEKAVEVLQAINLLLNFENFIIIMGIDPRVVTCAVETHYKNLLGSAGASGYEYLEKIIQIPFLIPEPNDREINLFIKEQLNESGQFKMSANHEAKKETSETQEELNHETPKEKTSEHRNDVVTESPNEILLDRAFSEEEEAVFIDLNEYIKHNPRHIKRLINIYRFVRALAKHKASATILRDPNLIIYWLVICGQWPYSMRIMLNLFDKLLNDKKIDLEKPPEEDPLEYLYEQAISGQEFLVENQMDLDYDLRLLPRLLAHKSGLIRWNDLERLRQFTININPAMEIEINSRKSSKDSQYVTE